MHDGEGTSEPAGQPRQRKRRVSFRSSLLRNLLILILLLSTAVLGVSYYAADKAMRTLCQDLVLSKTGEIESELRRFFEPIPAHLHTFQQWARLGVLDDDRPPKLNLLFAPILDGCPQLSGISIGDAEGNGYLVAKNPEGKWTNQLVSPETVGTQTRWLTWENLDGAVEQTTRKEQYDPRARPWYLQAADQDYPDETVFWTEPYSFFTGGAPGITASVRVQSPKGIFRVLSVDLLLEEISKLTTSMKVSPQGFVVVTTSDVRAIGLPRHPRFEDSSAIRQGFLKPPAELGIPLITEASNQIRKHFSLEEGEILSVTRGLSDENQPFRWEFEGDSWWSYVRPCKINNGPQLWIGVAAPEEDFLSEIRQARTYNAMLLGSALFAAGFLSVRMAKKYSEPMRALIDQNNRLRNLDTDKIETPDSGIQEIAELHDASERMRVALDSFARYVPSDVVKELMIKGEAAVIGGRNTAVSILFTDIEGFSKVAEGLEPDALANHMAAYFEAMTGVIESTGGTIDKLIGDAILAFWGAPSENLFHARDALRAAIACRDTLDRLNPHWAQQNLPPLPTRFGVSTGPVVVGNVGAPRHLSYTALGDAVNLASRLEGLNTFYGTRILASEASVQEAGQELVFRRIDRVRVKGRQTPELIYEVIGEKGAVDQKEVQLAEAYEKALDAYFEGNFNGALEHLRVYAEEKPYDQAAVRLAEFCRSFLQMPPAQGWDGVSNFQTKTST